MKRALKLCVIYYVCTENKCQQNRNIGRKCKQRIDYSFSIVPSSDKHTVLAININLACKYINKHRISFRLKHMNMNSFRIQRKPSTMHLSTMCVIHYFSTLKLTQLTNGTVYQ